MSFLPPSGGVVRLAPPGRSEGGPGRVFHADGRSILKVQAGRRKQKIATQTDRKTLPSREASSSVLCSDSICSKTAPIALNALRIESKYQYDLFFYILYSIVWRVYHGFAQDVNDFLRQQSNFGEVQ